MSRGILLVLDSVGIGGAPDAEKFDDVGANTLGHIAEATGSLHIPNLVSLGLAESAKLACGSYPKNMDIFPEQLQGAFGCASEVSSGKDTPSGHWEIAGVPVLQEWHTFPNTIPTFPTSLTQSILDQSDFTGILGNRHASGTQIIDELGDEHIRTGNPIFYTSTDSVVQIAAHEESFGIDALYDLCTLTYELVAPLDVQRVIARPFIGKTGEYKRTGNRRDYCCPPPEKTLLDFVIESGGEVFGVGKISDIFAHQGISHTYKADGNPALFEATLEAMANAKDGDLIFTNFVDFDQLYGHRRDVSGYASCLEQFDSLLPSLLSELRPDDMLIITADHGNDPTWRGTDHTREQVPILIYGSTIPAGLLGLLDKSDTFADIGATLAHHLQIPFSSHGKSLIK